MDGTNQDDHKTLLHGTLDALVLKCLAREPRHGYGIARWLETWSGDALRIEEGSLYPALYRMEKRGFIASEWGRSDLGRRAKLYRVTPRGQQRLAEATKRWQSFASAVSKILVEPA